VSSHVFKGHQRDRSLGRVCDLRTGCPASNKSSGWVIIFRAA